MKMKYLYGTYITYIYVCVFSYIILYLQGVPESRIQTLRRGREHCNRNRNFISTIKRHKGVGMDTESSIKSFITLKVVSTLYNLEAPDEVCNILLIDMYRTC